MKRMNWILGTVILVFVIAFNITFTSKAYTEEQKAQAKAWLSAHGYSPDMGGASQAYQDYLNGKFDEEIGVDVNGDGIPATTQTTENTTEENTEADTGVDLEIGEASIIGEDTDSDSSNQETSNSETGIEVDKDEAQDDVLGQDETDINQEDENTEGTGEIEIEENEDKDAECGMETLASSESTLYQPGKQDDYQEGMMVLVLSAILMLLASLVMKK